MVMTIMNTTEFNKLKTSLRSKLSGMAMIDPQYNKCVKAFDTAEKIHIKKRKDGVTPEFYHMLNMLAFALTQHNLYEKPAEVYVCILLHDSFEDYPEYIDELNREFPDDMVYIERISKVIWQKNSDGSYHEIEKDKQTYMDEMANCVVCSVAKGIDRIHNISTMGGVFDIEKQIRYYEEARGIFLPMLKKARKKFHSQDPLYQLIKSTLNLLVNNTEHFILNLTGEKSDYSKCIKKIKKENP